MNPKSKCLLIAAFTVFMAVSAAHSETSFYFTGSSTSWISQGETELITATNGTIAFNNGYSYDHGLHLKMTTTAGEYWSIDMGAIDRGQLHVGLYTNATRFPFNNGTSPGLNFSGNGRGDNTLTGWFNVLSIAYSNNTLVSASIDFVQYDEGLLDEVNSGSVRYNTITSQPPPPSILPDNKLGVSTTGFGFNVTGSSNQVVVVDACTNLAAGWFPVVTNTLGTNAFYFSDPNWTNYHARFYRVRVP